MTIFSRLLPSVVLLTSSLLAQSAPVSISVEPAHPLIEHRDAEQRLNFDFALRNDSKETVRLIEVEMQVLDAAGRLALKKTVNSDGLRPGIEAVAPSLVGPGKVTDIFNPFYSMPGDVLLAHLEYEFRFLLESTPDQGGGKSAAPSDGFRLRGKDLRRAFRLPHKNTARYARARSRARVGRT